MTNEMYSYFSSGNAPYAVIIDCFCRLWYPIAGKFVDWGQQGRDISGYAVPLR